MAYCKLCLCGEKIVFETPMSFPEVCPVCGRWTMDFMTYREDDPALEQAPSPEAPEELEELEDGPERRYELRIEGGGVIPIPEEGGEVGRDGLGAELLKNCLSVSRRHLQVTPRPGYGVILKDISRYGTLLNGEPLKKDFPCLAVVPARVTLCNIELTLTERERGDPLCRDRNGSGI